MRFFPAAIAGAIATVVLSACQPAPDNSGVAEPPRPVLTKTMAFESVAADRFAGDVVARYETALGFRVLGRVISRSVEVGDSVSQGQQIAQLDSAEQELALRTAEANVAAAQAQLENLIVIEQRQQTLLSQNNVSAAVFESAQQSRRAGESFLAQAEAQLTRAQEQFDNTTLRAESAGLVTAVLVEPGQTIAIGQAVATMVQPDIREAVIAVIESEARTLGIGDAFTVTKQLDPSLSVPGVVREVSPQADSATRTVTVRIAMDDPSGKFRLGSTIFAIRSAADRQFLVVPAAAVLADDEGTSVWVLEPNGDTVARRPVVVEPQPSGAFVVSEGLDAGDVVVTAGVNSLTEGQKVRRNQGHSN